MARKNYVAIPPKPLKTDVLSTDSTFKLRDIVWYTGSDGVDVNLAASDFGSDNVGYGVFEPKTAREEWFTFSSANMATATTTGLTITARGLIRTSPYTTEATARKHNHESGSIVLLYTNSPAFYDDFANKDNDETITGLWQFPTGSNYPVVGASYSAPTSDTHVATKKYADDLAIAGAPDGSTTVKGIFEEATQAEIDADTAAGGTSARLAVNPSTLATSKYGRGLAAFGGYAADGGSTDAYAITLSPAIAAYTVGQAITFKAATRNTGAATLNINSVGAQAIVKDVSTALDTGDIKAGQMVTVVWDGTNFQMVTTNGPTPTGAVLPFAGRTSPAGYLLCDGSAVSRTTYAALFAVTSPTLGTFTVTIAAPGVVTLASHGLSTGDSVYLTTTGALPTGLAANTRYWVTKIDANTFKLATSLANALVSTNITTSGSQSGTHTSVLTPYGLGDGSTTFNVPNLKGSVPVGLDTTAAEFAGLGETGGAKTHTLVTGEMPAHTHTGTFGDLTGSAGAAVYSAANRTAASIATDSTGGGGAHNNLQPYVTMNYIVKV